MLPSFPLPPPFFKLYEDTDDSSAPLPPEPPPPPEGIFPLFGIPFDPVSGLVHAPLMHASKCSYTAAYCILVPGHHTRSHVDPR